MATSSSMRRPTAARGYRVGCAQQQTCAVEIDMVSLKVAAGLFPRAQAWASRQRVERHRLVREKGADRGLGSRALAAGPHHGMVQAATLSLSGCASSLILKTAGTMAVTSACTETEGRDVQASCYDSGRAAAALRSFPPALQRGASA
jgi:hypothetical protein